MHLRKALLQRGLIYTESKYQVVFARYVTHSFMSSESFRQQMGSSSSALLLVNSPQRLQARGLTLSGILLTSAGGERQGADFFSDGSLQEQAIWAEAAELRATANFSCCKQNLHSSHDHHSKYAWYAARPILQVTHAFFLVFTV